MNLLKQETQAVCVCERKRETETERETERGTERDREIERQTERTCQELVNIEDKCLSTLGPPGYNKIEEMQKVKH